MCGHISSMDASPPIFFHFSLNSPWSTRRNITEFSESPPFRNQFSKFIYRILSPNTTAKLRRGIYCDFSKFLRHLHLLNMQIIGLSSLLFLRREFAFRQKKKYPSSFYHYYYVYRFFFAILPFGHSPSHSNVKSVNDKLALKNTRKKSRHKI